MSTGEIIAEAGTEVTRSLADDIQNAAVPYVWIQGESRNIKVLSYHDGRSDDIMWTATRRISASQSSCTIRY